MSYKSFKGKWQAFGEKPIISILSTGLICFNKSCYDAFVKPTTCKYVKLYYEPETRKVAFELKSKKPGDFVFAINLTKTGLLAVVNAKPFLEHFGIKPEGKSRSFYARPTVIHETSPGYKRTYRGPQGIEIRLDEYLVD